MTSDDVKVGEAQCLSAPWRRESFPLQAVMSVETRETWLVQKESEGCPGAQPDRSQRSVINAMLTSLCFTFSFLAGGQCRHSGESEEEGNGRLCSAHWSLVPGPHISPSASSSASMGAERSGPHPNPKPALTQGTHLKPLTDQNPLAFHLHPPHCSLFIPEKPRPDCNDSRTSLLTCSQRPSVPAAPPPPHLLPDTVPSPSCAHGTLL